MRFDEIPDRLASFPENTITFYDQAGLAVSKRYPEVLADIRRTVARLQQWGVEPGMRVGILASNSYEWAVHDIALAQLKCTSVAFPEEFNLRTSSELIEEYSLGLLLLSRRDNWPAVMPGRSTVYIEDQNTDVEITRHARATSDEQPIFSLTFSSGTAGRIKCLITNRRGAEETIASFYRLFDFRSDDSFLVFLPLSSFQQRLMVYAGFYYGFNLLLVSPAQALKALTELKPTLILAPPLLYESIHNQFKNAVRNLGLGKRMMLRFVSGLGAAIPVAPIRSRLLNVCYGKIYESLGGRIRLMWTGMAPIKRSTLDFFAKLRLPLFEAYGLTECGAITTNTPSHNRRGSVGRPVIDGSVFLAPDGEIMVRQEHLQTTGYLDCDENEQALTYVGPNLVATGDIGRFDDDGYLYLVGRKKEIIITTQGFKTHPETLEALIDRCPVIDRSVVFGNDMPYLVALISISAPLTDAEAIISKHIERMNEELTPAGRIAKFVITTDQFTRDNGFLTRNLKLDRRAIFRHFERRLVEGSEQRDQLDGANEVVAPVAASADIRERVRIITEIWREVLNVDQIRRDDNFFDLGGNSLLLSRMHGKLVETFKREIPLVQLFNHPTIESLARYLDQQQKAIEEFSRAEEQTHEKEDKQQAVAIIGLAGRFPGAKSVDELWRNLRDGIESVRFFSNEELEAAGVKPSVFNRPDYVRAKPVLDDMDLFDTSFFGFNPREAELMDPQHRVFLECASDALENAGYNPERYRGKIGVYAGASMSSYVFNALVSLNGLESMGALQQLSIGNGPWSLPTRASYKLNLKGPSVSVQTACSTSLAAVHMARQSLLDGECDIALAGGVSINPRNEGYVYEEGGVLSPTGHCRAFDANAKGTIVGDGVGLVVLKRLSQAIADGDTIHAVLLGSAMNNDGSVKIGFTAPSIDGQADVIRAAQADAGVTADSITYVEGHGTGTLLGDPIEVQALTQAFRASTDKKGFCGLGSIKTNIGHLDTAAGIAGLIKATLALEHKQIPPSVNFEEPNPRIDFANSPFYVNNTLADWKANGHPRRAGVSSFGFGGTNIHVVVEEPPEVPADPGPGRPWNLIVLSAQTEEALAAASDNLKQHLEAHSELNLGDVAYTCQVGRRTFSERQTIVCSDIHDCVQSLESGRVVRGRHFNDHEPFVVFMFPGQGAQHVNMAAQLYRTEQTFKEVVDQCCDYLVPKLGFDLRTVIFADEQDAAEITAKLNQTSTTQPALFVIEYALARLWMEWGIRPEAMIGHSIGEYVAACIANVFSLEDALTLVAARGKLIGDLPGGAMLAVPFSEAEAESYLGSELSLAASNGPKMSVISGPVDAIDRIEAQLTEQGLICHRLHTSHAFHSAMVEPVVGPFAELVAKANPQPPQIPLISNVTGNWMKDAEATSPEYWSKHLRQTVRFARGLQTLAEKRRLVLLEVGPGQSLNTLASGQMDRENCSVVSSLPHPRKPQPEVASMLEALGRLWIHGVNVDWQGFNRRQVHRRVPLPTYPFERQRYWVESQPVVNEPQPEQQISKRANISDWFYVPGWKQTASPREFGSTQNGSPARWLVFVDQAGLGDEFAQRLKTNRQPVATVIPGDRFSRPSKDSYTINPRSEVDYSKLLKALEIDGKTPTKVVHFWNVGPTGNEPETFDAAQYRGLHSLVFLTKAISKVGITSPLKLFVVSTNLQSVAGDEVIDADKATLLGPCKVIPQEHPQVSCQSVDLIWPVRESEHDELISTLLAECHAKSQDPVIAYRGRNRWAQTYEAFSIESAEFRESQLKEGGVYLIAGALGRIGSIISEYLAARFRARLIWATRTRVPSRADWDEWLQAHSEYDAASVAIRKALKIESLGGSVIILTADAGNQEQMERLTREAMDHYGHINGIFHAAGQVVMEENAQTIQDVEEGDYDVHFHTKVKGLAILEKIVREVKPDFCFLISSISSVLGGLGLTAYTAANNFMDVFARAASQRTSIPWSIINLDTWQIDTGSLEQAGNLGASLAEVAITPAEGKEIFSRVIPRVGFQQVVVSTAPLQARIDRWIKLVSLRDAEKAQRRPGKLYPRPALSEKYEAPGTDAQAKLAEIWQRVLAIDKVGINDDFFGLGGNSLLATQLVMETREVFKRSVPLRDFFERPTIAELAKLLESVEAVDELPEIKPIPRSSLRIDRNVLVGARLV